MCCVIMFCSCWCAHRGVLLWIRGGWRHGHISYREFSVSKHWSLWQHFHACKSVRWKSCCDVVQSNFFLHVWSRVFSSNTREQTWRERVLFSFTVYSVMVNIKLSLCSFLCVTRASSSLLWKQTGVHVTSCYMLTHGSSSLWKKHSLFIEVTPPAERQLFN